METVNFTCGQCGSVMGVEAANVGKQVRCPHCQQVVMAPAPDAPVLQEPATSFETTFNLPPPDSESIFSAAIASGDDLFGDPVLKVELPPEEPAWTPPASEMPAPSLADSIPQAPTMPEPLSQAPAPLFPSLELTPPTPHHEPPDLAKANAPTFSEPAFLTPESSGGIPPPRVGLPGPEDGPHSGLLGSAMTSSDSSGLPAPTIRMPKSKAWVLPVLIVPLISYAILATIAVAILYMRLQNVRDPLEVLPDMGDYKGGTRIKSSAFMPRLPDPIKSELSAKLKVALGNTIRIGDLEVTPGKVQRRKIKYHQEGNARGEDSRQEALVLELRLRNVSDDVAFRPMDPFFTRKWKEKDGGIGPYTFLTVGDKHFYGGPLDANERHTHLMSVLGQNFDRELLPGEEMTTFICTDPDDSIQSALEKVKGSKAFLWRIQVRRGLVKVGDRDISATAVIGVEFNRQNIQ